MDGIKAYQALVVPARGHQGQLCGFDAHHTEKSRGDNGLAAPQQNPKLEAMQPLS